MLSIVLEVGYEAGDLIAVLGEGCDAETAAGAAEVCLCERPCGRERWGEFVDIIDAVVCVGEAADPEEEVGRLCAGGGCDFERGDWSDVVESAAC